ncbi:MAG: O-antigen ligase family protein [Thermoleophilia bacterium]
MEKTDSLPGWRGGAVLARLALGLLCGWVLIQLINRSWLVALLLILTLAVLLLDLSGYRAWVLLMAATLVSGFKYNVTGLNIRIDQLMLIFLIIGWLPAVLSGKFRLQKVPLLIPALLYIGINFFSSALFSPDKSGSYQGSVLLMLYVLMYVMTVTVLQEHPGKMKSAVKVMLVLGVAQALYALVAFAGSKGGVDLGGISPGHVESALSLQGGFEEPNLLGAFAAAMAIMFLALLTGKQKSISSVKLAAGTGIMLLVMILTFTRAAWIAFAIGLLLLVFLQKPSRNIFNPRAAGVVLAIIASLVILALPLANSLEANQVSQRFDNLLNFSEGSGEGRVATQQLAIERWKNAYLFGEGTLSMTSPDVYSSIDARWLYSSVIQSLHDTGLAGVAILAWFQIGVVVIVAKAARKTKDPFYRAVLAGFFASNVALMVSSQASSFLWLGFPWIFAGLAVAVASVASSEASHQKAAGAA